MGPTRKRDLTAAVVGAAAVGYLLVAVLYRWFPPITVWTGLSLLAVAVAEALWARYVRVKISDGEIGDGPGWLHPLVVARSLMVAKSVAAATSASGAAITYDIGHLRPPRDADRRAARSPADNLLERSLSLSGKHVRGFPKSPRCLSPARGRPGVPRGSAAIGGCPKHHGAEVAARCASGALTRS